MQAPLTVSFQEMPIDESMRSSCWKEAEKLERCFGEITSCHVTITTDRRKQQGNHVAVHVRLAVPGGEIVVSHSLPEHEAGEKSDLAIGEAFDAVRRQLLDHVRMTRRHVEHHAEPVRPLDRGETCSAAQDSFRGLPHGERLYLHERTGPIRPPGDRAGSCTE